MAVFDYFVYTSYRFSINKLGRNHDEALFSAIGLLSIYTFFLMIGLFAFVGIFVDNGISEFIVRGEPVFVILPSVIILLFWSIYYLKVANDINDINVKIANREKHKSSKNMRRLVYFILIAVPIFAFVSFRFYLKDW